MAGGVCVITGGGRGIGAAVARRAAAVGYAVCKTLTGPCARRSTRPLLATGGAVSGPGGASPVVGPDGSLRYRWEADLPQPERYAWDLWWARSPDR